MEDCIIGDETIHASSHSKAPHITKRSVSCEISLSGRHGRKKPKRNNQQKLKWGRRSVCNANTHIKYCVRRTQLAHHSNNRTTSIQADVTQTQLVCFAIDENNEDHLNRNESFWNERNKFI